MLALGLLPATLLVRWPQVCRVKTTFELLSNQWFHKHKFDEMLCKLDSTEFARSFGSSGDLNERASSGDLIVGTC